MKHGPHRRSPILRTFLLIDIVDEIRNGLFEGFNIDFFNLLALRCYFNRPTIPKRPLFGVRAMVSYSSENTGWVAKSSAVFT